MGIVKIPKRRYSLQDEGSSLRITIPSRDGWFGSVFLVFWLSIWAQGEFIGNEMLVKSVIQALIKIPDILSEVSKIGLAGLRGLADLPSVEPLELIWFAGWTAGGAIAIHMLLWQLAGSENIEVSSAMIQIQRGLFGSGRIQEHQAAQIMDLRIAARKLEINLDVWTRILIYLAVPIGPIVIDYGAKTFRFGGGMNEAEAGQILDEIASRFPQYRFRVRQMGRPAAPVGS